MLTLSYVVRNSLTTQAVYNISELAARSALGVFPIWRPVPLTRVVKVPGVGGLTVPLPRVSASRARTDGYLDRTFAVIAASWSKPA